MATNIHEPELPRKPRRLPRLLADHDGSVRSSLPRRCSSSYFFALFPLGYAIYLAGHYVDLTSINQIRRLRRSKELPRRARQRTHQFRRSGRP